MSDRYPNANFDSQADGESEEEGFDFDALKEKIGFVLRAPRRRPKLAIVVFLLIAVLGVTISITMPRTYNAQVKLLAQRSNVMTPILDPGHSGGDESPTKNVAEVILRRDNLIALVKQANLLDRFYASRSPALKLKDYLMSFISEPMTEEDKLHGLVATLEKKLTVVTDDSSITISVDWADAEMAYELVAIVQNNFLDAKYDSTVSMITDAIAILTEHSKTEAAQVDQALDEVARVQAAKNQAAIEAGQRAVVPPPVAAPGVRRAYNPQPRPAIVATAPDADLMKQLEDTRHQIKSIEDERARQLDTVRQQLAQAQLTFTPLHPTVQALQQKVDALKEPPSELVQLHAEERALMAKIAPTATPTTTQATPQQNAPQQAAPVAATPSTPEPVRPIILPSNNEEDGPSRLARSKLESAIYNYQEVMSRIDAAKLRLDINRAQFKYRYSVITPPEVPKKPKKPITTMIGIGSVVGALLLAFLVAGGADMAAGRVIEPWQVRRQLKIEVLGEFEPPKS